MKMTAEQIVEIIRKHKAECEVNADLYADVALSKVRRLPAETRERKQYAAAAQVDRLESILKEIGCEELRSDNDFARHYEQAKREGDRLFGSGRSS